MPPLPTDVWFYVVGWPTVALIAFGKGAFGGGLAVLGVPLLALVMSPLDAAVTTALLVITMDLVAIGAFPRKTWSIPDLVWLVPGLALGIAAGAFVFVSIDERIVGLAIGAVTLAFTLHHFTGMRERPPIPVMPALAMPLAALAGFTTFVAHAGGPPVALYLLRRGLDKATFTGTTIVLFMLANILKLGPYGAIALGETHTIMAALALAPVVPLGVWAGVRLNRTLDRKRLFDLCYVLVGIAGTKLVYDAVRAFL